jgi:hypothetical protein
LHRILGSRSRQGGADRTAWLNLPGPAALTQDCADDGRQSTRVEHLRPPDTECQDLSHHSGKVSLEVGPLVERVGVPDAAVQLHQHPEPDVLDVRVAPLAPEDEWLLPLGTWESVGSLNRPQVAVLEH